MTVSEWITIGLLAVALLTFLLDKKKQQNVVETTARQELNSLRDRVTALESSNKERDGAVQRELDDIKKTLTRLFEKFDTHLDYHQLQIKN